MAVKINFDSANNVEQPTFILAHRNGDKMGTIPAVNIVFKDSMTSGSELSFRVYKNDNNSVYELWDDLKDFKLVYCPEWNIWFEISVELEETNDLIKNIQGKSLGEAELSQIMIYDIEINTEDDIDNDVFTQYGKAILYSENPKISMLNRLMDDKASHYHIGHIDNSLINETIQNLKTFSFDNKSLYDCLLEIAEELNALLVIDSSTVTNDVERLGEISRTISMYDLETYCNYCHYRGDYSEFVDANGNLVCPKCSHTDGESYVVKGYGDFTNIYVSTENLTDDINYSTDKDSVKNCFKLEAGDDYLTDAVINCNPNGSQYIWYISDETKSDMSPDLVSKLEAYDVLFNKHQSLTSNDVNNYSVNVTAYNELIKKYSVQPYTGHTLQEVLADTSLLRYPLLTNPIIGFPKLMEGKYNAVDFETYLEHSLMPSVEMEQTTAENERDKLQDQTNGLPSYTIAAGKALSIMNYSTYTSQKTVENTVQNAVKLLVNPNYKFTLDTISTSYDDSNPTHKTGSWTGTITIEKYYEDENDPPATTNTLTVEIDNNNGTYFKQLIDKKLDSASSKKSYDMVSLFELSITDGTGGQASDSSFANELKKYSLTSLEAFRKSGEACLNILIEQGVSNPDNWNEITDPNGNLYTQMYIPYNTKLQLIDSEIAVRENEIKTISTVLDEINAIIENVNTALDFKTNIGEYWTEFCSYRREDTYSNDNYISDGLNDAEVFARALEFLNIAKKEIFKSATLQHSISSTLHNLLTIKEFQPLVDHFETGNWIQVEIDGKLYKLRMIEYEIDFDNLDKLNVEFSDVTQIASGYSDIEWVLNSAAAMSSSYSTVSRQANKGSNSNDMLAGWFEDGLEVTNVKIKTDSVDQTQSWDDNGMLFRRYIPETEEYDKVQMKIINTTLAITPDNWETVKAAVGKFRYRDIIDGGTWKDGYGINGEVVVGKLIIGEELGIYNSGNTLSFNQNGLKVSGSKNEILFTPSSTNTSVMTIKNKTSGNNIFSFDTNGNLVITGIISASADSNFGNWTVGTNAIYYNNANFNNANGMYFGVNGISITNKFAVDSTGKLEATGAVVSGTLTAGSGSSVGGWDITANHIQKDNTSNGGYRTGMQSNASAAFYAGCNTSAGGNIADPQYSNFYVTHSGYLYARSANISGTINATGGSIGGFSISSTELSSGGYIKIKPTMLYISSDTTAAKNAFYALTGNNKNYIALRGNGAGAYFGYIPNTLDYTNQVPTSNGWGMFFDKGCRIEAFDGNITITNSQSILLSAEEAEIKIGGNNNNSLHPTISNATTLGKDGKIWKSVWAHDTTINTSDRKAKDTIGVIDFADDFIMALNPITFMWKDGDHRRTRMGFIAQEVAELCKSLNKNLSVVTASYITNDETPIKEYFGEEVEDSLLSWGMSYEQLIAPMIVVMQNQNQRILDLETEIQELKEN